MESLSKGIGAIVLVICVLIYTVFTSGFLFMKFYYWFLKPTIPMLPDFTFMQSVAICLFLATVRNGSTSELKDEYKKEFSTRMTTDFLKPWLLLLIGFLFKIIFF